MPFTNYEDQNLIQAIFGDTSPTLPATLYFGLSTTTPTQAKGSSTPYWNFTEPSGNGYARVAVTNNTTNFGAVSSEPTAGYEIQNNVAITFATSTGSWSGSSFTYVGIFDASTGGNLLAYAPLTTAESVSASGVQLSFPAGSFTFTNS